LGAREFFFKAKALREVSGRRGLVEDFDFSTNTDRVAM
jgi:hypothetical protein